MTQQKEFTCCLASFLFLFRFFSCTFVPVVPARAKGRLACVPVWACLLWVACLVIMSLSLFCGNDRDHSTMKKSRKFYTTVHDWADFPLLGWALLYSSTKRRVIYHHYMGPVKGIVQERLSYPFWNSNNKGFFSFKTHVGQHDIMKAKNGGKNRKKKF